MGHDLWLRTLNSLSFLTGTVTDIVSELLTTGSGVVAGWRGQQPTLNFVATDQRAE